MADFHYSAQIRRFLIQFSKIFSQWYVTKGKDPNGNDILVRIPIMYGNSSRQAANIIANNSASNMPSAPLLTYYISGLEYDQRRTQNPSFVDKINVRQRAYNPESESYETTQGQAFTVERLMPVPYTLRITVDLWTTNEQQKQEFIEQLGPLFNPGLEIQSTDNFVDWTSLSIVYQDGINYSSRSIPVGTGNPIDIFTWKFYMPIWLTTNAKVKKMGVIHKIVASIFDGSSMDDIQEDDLLLGTRQKITPYGYRLLLQGNQLQLLPADQPSYPPNNSFTPALNPNTDLYWSSLLNVYGAIKPGISQIWLQNPYMDNDIVGTIVPNPTDDRFLIYNIDPDTLPVDTLSPVNSVIDPTVSGPGSGLPLPVAGTRYLIVDSIGQEGAVTEAWGSLVAYANDIIEYDGDTEEWVVSFDSITSETVQYVTNQTSGIQFRYVATEGDWVKSYDGFYDQGDYSVVI